MAPIKATPASSKHEQFYAGLVKIMIDLHVNDEEAAALLGKALGYNRGLNPEASSAMHLVSVFRFNLRLGERQIKSGEVVPRP